MHNLKRSTIKYRSDIDGLRALAVLSVVCFHAFPNFLKGGFIGVDIFFFISGYLISSIILHDLEQNKFKFSKFYWSRVKRIIPALVIVLFSCLLFGWAMLFPIEYKQLGKHITGGLIFLDNFLTYREIGYFDIASDHKPLLHLWSLSIEEQFYLIFPFVIWMTWKINSKYILLVLSFLIAISFLTNLFEVKHNINGSFFFPQTRIWELLIGGITAYAAFAHKNIILPSNKRFSIYTKKSFSLVNRIHNNSYFSHIFSVLGLSIIIGSICFIRKDMLFPGYWPIFPLIGMMLLIFSGPTALCNKYILSSSLLVWIGLISYPLYLWHWPILSFLRIIEDEQLSTLVCIFAIILSFILSWLTYAFIEKPVRFGKNNYYKVMAFSCVALILSCLGMMIYFGKVQPRSLRLSQIMELVNATNDWEHPKGLLPVIAGDKKSLLYHIGDSQNTTIFYGDSNMAQYSSRIVDLFEKENITNRKAIFMTLNGCAPLLGVGEERCMAMADDLLNIAKNPDIDRIVISGHWFRTLNDELFRSNERTAQVMLDHMNTMIQNISKPGRTIYLVLNIPFGKEFNPRSYINRKNLTVRKINPLSKLFFVESNKHAYEAIQAISNKHNLIIIDPLDFLCKVGECLAFDGMGKAKYKDNSHLRSSYVKNHIKYLDQTVH